jgi:hypothetical protein
MQFENMLQFIPYGNQSDVHHVYKTPNLQMRKK